MAEFPNKGILSKNERKERDTHPDIKGNADVTCACCGKTTAYWMDGWKNPRKDGSGSFYKISFKPKDGGAPVFPDNPSEKPYQHPLSVGAPKYTGPAEKPLDDEIPF